jgi:hypothetical protein
MSPHIQSGIDLKAQARGNLGSLLLFNGSDLFTSSCVFGKFRIMGHLETLHMSTADFNCEK